MKILYSHNDQRLELTLLDNADWILFNGIADAILKKFKGKLVAKLDGLDERYWDIEIRGIIVSPGFASKVLLIHTGLQPGGTALTLLRNRFNGFLSEVGQNR